MKKVICVTRKEIAEQISNDCGCKYMIKDLGDTKVYSFLETDKIHKYLKSNFSKKEWYYDDKMYF